MTHLLAKLEQVNCRETVIYSTNRLDFAADIVLAFIRQHRPWLDEEQHNVRYMNHVTILTFQDILMLKHIRLKRLGGMDYGPIVPSENQIQSCF